VTKIKLKNTSNVYITYKVVPTIPNLFKLSPGKGILNPKDTGEVIVTSRRRVGEQSIAQILNAAFYVLSTPIYFSCQVSLKKIKVFWQAYGTRLFPFGACQQQLIETILPDSDEYMEDYSVMLKGILGNITGKKKDVPSIRWIYGERHRAGKGLMEISDEEYLRTWMPREEDIEETHLVMVQSHISEMNQKMKNMRVEIQATKNISKLAFWFVTIFVIYMFWPLLKIEKFGPNGAWLWGWKEEVPKPKSSWFSWW